jgi:protein-S-isoprenylcysteine O-methyltransferase Ste14
MAESRSDQPKKNWAKIARRIRVPLGFAFAVFYLWLARPTWSFVGLGAMAILPGLVLRALASGHVRKNEALATTGPYAYTRNPLYLGSLLIGVGFAIAARSWWIGLVLMTMFFAIYLPVIYGEEKFLRDKFRDYAEYARNVPRTFPRFTRYHGAQKGSGEFSFPLYRQHREYNALLGAVFMLAVLIAKMELLRH